MCTCLGAITCSHKKFVELTCSPDASGFSGRWTQDPNSMDNSFYIDMAKAELSWELDEFAPGRTQWCALSETVVSLREEKALRD